MVVVVVFVVQVQKCKCKRKCKVSSQAWRCAYLAPLRVSESGVEPCPYPHTPAAGAEADTCARLYR